MFATAIIAFREFLEAFLIVGVFLGISRKLHLKKEFEIAMAAGIGIVFSLLLSTGTYFFGGLASHVFTEDNAELLENYLKIFSGGFLAYVIFSLHGVIQAGRGKILIAAHAKLQKNVFDISLFFTIMFLVIREGFEIALFTASVSLFSAFAQNMLGLFAGFAAATALGLATTLAYVRLPIGKVFRVTEYMIILLGASLVQNGITELLEIHAGIYLSRTLSLHLNFLPDEHSLLGHFIQSFIGIDQGFSLPRLALMLYYIAAVYFLVIRRRSFTAPIASK
jgi:high-affinity iron transporter